MPSELRKYSSFAGLLVLVFILLLFLSQVFRGELILSPTFSLGAISIRYYGLFLALAAGAGYWLAVKSAPKFGIEIKQVDRIVFWLIIGGLIGARLYHVASQLPHYFQAPLQIFFIWRGGLSIFGAIIGGMITLFILNRIHRFAGSILPLLDWLTPSLIIGQIIGRFGNLFNYEAYGYPTNLPWKMLVPPPLRPNTYWDSAYYHPLFLYEALWSLAVLVIILRLRKKLPAPGTLFLSYLFLYNSGRFFLELLRLDSTFIGNWRLNSITSLALVLTALGSYLYIRYAQTSSDH
jgi:phosphatidylglycerol---prolipoprotein diacylglyceryl transferase